MDRHQRWLPVLAWLTDWSTAKSEDGFRKTQLLTEEATETPSNVVDRGMSLYLGSSAQYKR